MLTLGIILAALLLIGFTRVGVRASRTPDGKMRLILRVGILRINLLKKLQKAKDKPKKPAKPKKEAKPKEEKPVKRFSIQDISFYFEHGKKVLSTLRRSVRIDRLILRVTFGGSDPCDDALFYARSEMALGVLRPAVTGTLRVKKQDLVVALDFDIEKIQWSGDFAVTVSIGRIFLISFSLLKFMLKITRRKAA